MMGLILSGHNDNVSVECVLITRLKNLVLRLIRSSTLKTIGIFASANALSSILSGVGGILQARWVTPDTLGEFQKYTILTSYLAIALVLVQDGLSRQYPYLIGKGQQEEAMTVAATAKVWYVCISIVFAFLFAVLSFVAILHRDFAAAAGWATQIVIAVASSYGMFLSVMYRRSLEFKRLSYNSLISSVANFLCLIAVRFLGYYGLAIKYIVTNASRVFLDARYMPVKVKMAWNSRCFFSLAKISIPLSIEGYIRTSFMTATFGYFVVRYCSARDLGLFGVAAAFEGFAAIFVSAIMQIFDVKMANRYGETGSVKASFRSLMLPTLFGFFCSVISALILCALIGPFIRICVPRYVDSIPVVYVLSFGLPLGALLIPTRLLRVALMYKSIYLMTFVRVASLVLLIHLVPHRIEWFAGCKMVAEFLSILVGYVILVRTIWGKKG